MLVIRFTILAVLMWVALTLTGLAFATDKPKPKPTVTPVVQSTPADYSKEYLWGSAAVGGLAVTALQKSEHPWLYANATCIAAATAVNAADPGSFNNKNSRSAVGCCLLGATATGLVFGKNFFGWQKAIKF